MSGIYLDNLATTPVDSRVAEAMSAYFMDEFGNPHANTHRRGLNARRAVENARRKLAKAVGASPKDIVFTSGATEANNLAILGLAGAARGGKRVRIVTQATEHRSVLGPCDALREDGFEIIAVRVGRDGLIDLDELASVVDKATLLVSVMSVNNETGVIQPIEKIAEICTRNGTLFHTDCAQGLGKICVDVSTLQVDLASFSAHKVYGPKGIGSLFVRNLQRAPIKPIARGGGQEAGLRPGTLPVPLCVGFGEAADIARTEQSEVQRNLSCLEDRLWCGIRDAMPEARINGGSAPRAPGCLNVHFPGHHSDGLITAWRGIEVAKGSACEATKTRSSHVLRAMGASPAHADASIRIGIGRFTTAEEIDEVVCTIRDTVS